MYILKSLHKRIFIEEIILCIVVFFTHCSIQSDHHKRAYSQNECDNILEVKYTPGSIVTQYKDSLLKTGIDTILVIENSYEGNHNYQLLCDIKQPKNKLVSLRYYSEPGYIFWRKNNRFYVKKIDQFGFYKTIEREYFQQYSLYDFYYRDSVRIKGSDLKLLLGNQNDEYCCINRKKDFGTRYFENNFIKIELVSGQSLFKVSIDKNKFRPMKTYSGNSGVKTLNDDVNYYQIQQLSICQWIRLIEAELYEIESTSLWFQPEK